MVADLLTKAKEPCLSNYIFIAGERADEVMPFLRTLARKWNESSICKHKLPLLSFLTKAIRHFVLKILKEKRLLCFNGISTFMGYSMSKKSLKNDNCGTGVTGVRTLLHRNIAGYLLQHGDYSRKEKSQIKP